MLGDPNCGPVGWFSGVFGWKPPVDNCPAIPGLCCGAVACWELGPCDCGPCCFSGSACMVRNLSCSASRAAFRTGSSFATFSCNALSPRRIASCIILRAWWNRVWTWAPTILTSSSVLGRGPRFAGSGGAEAAGAAGGAGKDAGICVGVGMEGEGGDIGAGAIWGVAFFVAAGVGLAAACIGLSEMRGRFGSWRG